MNYKLEKFWNSTSTNNQILYLQMNYKLEKFWNVNIAEQLLHKFVWTINLKSFEIKEIKQFLPYLEFMNYKLKKFWNYSLTSFIVPVKSNEL